MDMYTDLSHYIKQKALDEGAILVGYTKIRRIEPVIILGFPFTDQWFLKRPLRISKWLGKEYIHSKEVQDNIAKFLTNEGYTAHQKTILSLYGDFRPLAVSAGLGEWGRNGIIVNKDYGSKILFAAIFTNAPLEITPQQDKKPPQKHCNNCQQCIQSCPANAFEGNTFHLSRCLSFVMRGCSECVKACSH